MNSTDTKKVIPYNWYSMKTDEESSEHAEMPTEAAREVTLVASNDEVVIEIVEIKSNV